MCTFCVYIVISQSCPSSSDPIGCSLPDSSIHGISQARYQSGLPFPTPRDLPHPGIESVSLAWQADSLPLCHLESLYVYYTSIKLSYKILLTTYAYNGLHYFFIKNWSTGFTNKFGISFALLFGVLLLFIFLIAKDSESQRSILIFSATEMSRG